MGIRVKCTGCERVINVKAYLAGKRGICPHCQTRINIPFEQSAIDTSVAVKVDDDTSDRNETATEGVQQRIDNLFKLLRDTSQPETPQFPSQIGKYRLQEVIGEGGFGVVYLAQDQELSRPVALKLAKAFSAGNQQFEEVAKEAKTLAKLEHPNIAQIYDVGIEAGVAYIASQYVNGIPLSEWLREQTRSETEIVNVFKLICDAVEHAHQRGVVHRDLKPTNILIDAQANPSILDFGLAKITDTEMSFSDDGRILGTPAYMSPEQARGETTTVDQSTDIFALGVMLCEAITGLRPFSGETGELIHRISNDPITKLPASSRASKDLQTICLKCLEFDRLNRFSSAIELKLELTRVQQHVPIKSRKVTPLGRLSRWRKRRPLAFALSTALLVTLVSVAILSISLSQRSRDNEIEQIMSLTNDITDAWASSSAQLGMLSDVQRSSTLERAESLIRLVRASDISEMMRTSQDVPFQILALPRIISANDQIDDASRISDAFMSLIQESPLDESLKETLTLYHEFVGMETLYRKAQLPEVFQQATELTNRSNNTDHPRILEAEFRARVILELLGEAYRHKNWPEDNQERLVAIIDRYTGSPYELLRQLDCLILLVGEEAFPQEPLISSLVSCDEFLRSSPNQNYEDLISWVKVMIEANQYAITKDRQEMATPSIADLEKRIGAIRQSFQPAVHLVRLHGLVREQLVRSIFAVESDESASIFADQMIACYQQACDEIMQARQDSSDLSSVLLPTNRFTAQATLTLTRINFRNYNYLTDIETLFDALEDVSRLYEADLPLFTILSIGLSAKLLDSDWRLVTNDSTFERTLTTAKANRIRHSAEEMIRRITKDFADVKEIQKAILKARLQYLFADVRFLYFRDLEEESWQQIQTILELLRTQDLLPAQDLFAFERDAYQWAAEQALNRPLSSSAITELITDGMNANDRAHKLAMETVQSESLKEFQQLNHAHHASSFYTLKAQLYEKEIDVPKALEQRMKSCSVYLPFAASSFKNERYESSFISRLANTLQVYWASKGKGLGKIPASMLLRDQSNLVQNYEAVFSFTPEHSVSYHEPVDDEMIKLLRYGKRLLEDMPIVSDKRLHALQLLNAAVFDESIAAILVERNQYEAAQSELTDAENALILAIRVDGENLELRVWYQDMLLNNSILHFGNEEYGRAILKDQLLIDSARAAWTSEYSKTTDGSRLNDYGRIFLFDYLYGRTNLIEHYAYSERAEDEQLQLKLIKELFADYKLVELLTSRDQAIIIQRFLDYSLGFLTEPFRAPEVLNREEIATYIIAIQAFRTLMADAMNASDIADSLRFAEHLLRFGYSGNEESIYVLDEMLEASKRSWKSILHVNTAYDHQLSLHDQERDLILTFDKPMSRAAKHLLNHDHEGADDLPVRKQIIAAFLNRWKTYDAPMLNKVIKDFEATLTTD